MGCSSCGQHASTAVSHVPETQAPRFVATTESKAKNNALPMVGESESDKKVKLTYLGGGYSSHGQGCRSCGGTGTSYKFVSSERIQFVSEDAPDGWFNQLFTVGRDYYVTEKQAEYLLSLTYQSRVGRVVNKFKRAD